RGTLSPDGKRLAISGRAIAREAKKEKPAQRPVLKVWDTSSGQTLFTIREEARPVQVLSRLAFSSDGKKLALVRRLMPIPGDFPPPIGIKVWDANTGQFLVGRNVDCNVPAHNPLSVEIALSPEGEWLAMAGPTDTIAVWNLRKERVKRTLRNVADE